jgi:hypothetical protein
LIVTDLPTPEVPMMNSTSPLWIARSMPRSTGLPSKALVTPLNSISGGAAAVTGRRR